jgi:hypothetical protein
MPKIERFTIAVVMDNYVLTALAVVPSFIYCFFNSIFSNSDHVPWNVRFKVFTAVTMKNAVFLDVSRVTLVRTDVSEEPIASIIRVTRYGELNSCRPDDGGDTFLSSSETSVLIRAARRIIPEDNILHVPCNNFIVVNNELGRMWKELVFSGLKAGARHLRNGKIHENHC